MREKINIGEVIKVAIILFAITAISAALLGFVNSQTAPLIAENNIKKEQTALEAVLPGCEFEEIKDISQYEALTDGKGEISKVYKATSGGSLKGACVITVTSGYDVGIQTVTGVDKDLKVTGVEIIKMKETPGLGANANKPEFKEQYKGRTYEVGVSKNGATDTEIQAISGATKTSRGVTNGVNIALKVAEKIVKGGVK